MPIRKLHATLDELHAQLEASEQLDPGERARLRAMMDEIRETLAKPEAEPAPEPQDEEEIPSATERLKEFVEHFEEEHPTLSRRIADFVDSMHKLGF